MPRSDYNVLRWTAIALNNFIQYSHCQAGQLFRSEVTNMQPTKEFRAARKAFRRDQQS